MSRFNLPLNKLYSKWEMPQDWIDISDVEENEINLLVGDFGLCTPAFIVTTTDSADYTVNWGDGNSDNYASGALASHTYTKGAGTSCSLGYTTFKIVISSTTTILTFKVSRHSLSTNYQFQPLLSCKSYNMI